MTKRRSLGVLFIICCIFLLTGCTANEIPIPLAEANVYVYDDDNLFDESFERQLNNMLIELEEKTGAEFAIVTVESLLGNTIEHYSITVATELGIGKKDEDNGVLLIMSKSDNRVRLEIGEGSEGILNDSKCGRILDEFFVPHRENEDYLTATSLTTQAVINVIATDYGVTVNGVDSTISASEPSSDLVWVWVLVCIALFFLMLWLETGSSSGSSTYIGGSHSSSSSGSSFGGGSFGGGGSSR